MSAGVSATRRSAMAGYKDRLRTFAHAVLDPVVGGLASSGITANHLTVAGLVLSVGAGIAFYVGASQVAALILVAAGLCDILDGQLARRTGGETRFGAFLDSTLDRIAEAAVLTGIAGFFAGNLLGLYTKSNVLFGQVLTGEIDLPSAIHINNNPTIEGWAWLASTLIAVAALAGSFMVSYTRARAEGLGLECKVGWFERPERIVLIIIAGLIHLYSAMSIAVAILAILSFFTAFQRMAHVWRNSRQTAGESTEA